MKALERLKANKRVKKISRAIKCALRNGNGYEMKLRVDALWFLPDTPIPNGNWEHLDSCAQLFVSLNEIVESWQWERQGKFRPDRIAVGEKTIYFEVDRGTEDLAKIMAKLDAYVKHYQETQEEFIVIFTVEDYIDAFGKLRTSAKTRGANILSLFDDRKLPGNFYVCYHEQLVKNPFAPLVSRFQKDSLKAFLKPVENGVVG